MAKFYNPYHWVPTEKPNDAQRYLGVSRADFGNGKPDQVTHERFVPATNSGRLVVKLTTVTPTVIGAQQSREAKLVAQVTPYMVNDRAAIPASTLRGMVGAVIEAASNGPMRVLEDRAFSYRKQMSQYLSAVGMIVDDGGVMMLKPLALPTLESRDGGRTFEALPRFKKIFPTPQFKVYVGQTAPEIRGASFPWRTARDEGDQTMMPVKQLAWAGNAVVADRSLHVKASRHAVAQDAHAADPLRKGYLRVLGCWGKDRESIPQNKKHELWLPLDPTAKPIPILPLAIERFHELADLRTDEDKTLPFEPRDTTRNLDRSEFGHRFRLKPGDMVYFDVDDHGRVREIALSSIWRGRVEDKASGVAAKAYKFFPEELLPLRPLSAQAPERKISLSEQMLGFVEDRSKEKREAQKKTEPMLALASRLRFADACLREGAEDVLARDPVTLKILSSPKTPSPSLYFKGANGRGAVIAKAALEPSQHAAQGRKWYLHARSGENEQPWKSGHPQESPDQKNSVRPIRQGAEFFFHVDVDNLTQVELGLLAYALEPSSTFHHKVGMGKPLGLGSVKLEVMGWFPIDRQRRYSLAGLRRERYGTSEVRQADLPERYSAERTAQAGATFLSEAREELLRTALVPALVRKALEMLGNFATSPLTTDVRYPTNVDQRDKEKEHFKWFQFNEGHKERGRTMSPQGQFLKPLAGESSLPGLLELDWDAPPAGRW